VIQASESRSFSQNASEGLDRIREVCVLRFEPHAYLKMVTEADTEPAEASPEKKEKISKL
jgi:hypothetical protein